MQPWLLDILTCVGCRRGGRLELAVTESDGEEVTVGHLTCVDCGARYPIIGGVPRFVERGEDYCENFGFQWQRWKELQIDRLGGHHISESRFFAEVPWDRAWMPGKLILDAGCGAGRFADVAASHGARVVACDLSDAIDACQQVTRVHRGAVQCVQASIFALPFREHVFDGLYCLGVIQHTPDPAGAMRGMPVFLKPGGLLAYDFYQRTRWEQPFVPRWLLRRFTRTWPTERTHMLSHVLTALTFPVGAIMTRVPVIAGFCAVLPAAVVRHPELSLKREYAWSLLETFDWYGPMYEQRQDHNEVRELLSNLGIQIISARSGVVTGRTPQGWGMAKAHAVA